MISFSYDCEPEDIFEPLLTVPGVGKPYYSACHSDIPPHRGIRVYLESIGGRLHPTFAEKSEGFSASDRQRSWFNRIARVALLPFSGDNHALDQSLQALVRALKPFENVEFTANLGDLRLEAARQAYGSGGTPEGDERSLTQMRLEQEEATRLWLAGETLRPKVERVKDEHDKDKGVITVVFNR